MYFYYRRCDSSNKLTFYNVVTDIFIATFTDVFAT